MTTYITDPAAAGDPATDLGGTDLGEALSLRRRIPVQLAQPLVEVAARQQITVIGFPKATDIDFGPLAALSAGTLNNIGDPTVPGLECRNVKDFEREVVAILADLFAAPAQDRWGCVTTGGTEGNLYGLHLARTLHPGGVVYFADSAHYSVPKAAHLLGMPTAVVPATAAGELDYDALREAVLAHPGRPAVVVATVGTTMTEAVDDVAAITTQLDRARVPVGQRYIHVDAALTGIPLALDATGGPGGPGRAGRAGSGRHPSVDLSGVVDSLSISGHKFLATPEPCGVVLTRRRHRDRVAHAVAYIGGVDATIAGSRSGHTVLQLWWALRSLDLTAHRHRAARARAVAAYTVDRLAGIGWPAWRHEHAFTVVIPAPPRPLIQRWSLATADGSSHIICVPGVNTQTIDRFVEELATARW